MAIPKKTLTCNCPPVKRLSRNKWSGPEAKPFNVRAHHLLCAACVRGGCKTPPAGRAAIDRLLKVLWSCPHVPLAIRAEQHVAGPRQADHAGRRKDLDVCRLLGLFPNTVLSAFHAYSILFSRQPTLQGLCRGMSGDPVTWPECPHARAGYYEKIAGVPNLPLRNQFMRGDKLAGKGIWALVCPRSRAEMRAAKRKSSAFIANQAERLLIRANHTLCILCTRTATKPLIEDNLVELRRKMEANPEIPITLVEGCDMVCDPCPVYHVGERTCHSKNPKNLLRDLRLLEQLGLPPGATLPARELYRRLFDRIHTLREVCAWGDGSCHAPFWAPCGGCQSHALEEAKAANFLGALR